MYSFKPDFEKSRMRYEAFWNCAIVDRPPVDIRIKKPGAKPAPHKDYATLDEQWLDVDFRAET